MATLGLATLLTLSSASAFAGCGKKKGIVWYTGVSNNINLNSVVSKALRAKTGLKFAFDKPSNGTADKLALMLASNDLPDMITIKGSDQWYKKLIKSKKLYALDELAAKYGVELDVHPDIMYTYGVNGHIYGLPNYYYLTDQYTKLETNGGMMIRKDWYQAYMEYVIDNQLTDDPSYDLTTVAGATYAMRWVYNNLLTEKQKQTYYGMQLDPFTTDSFQGVAWMCQYFGVRFEAEYDDNDTLRQWKKGDYVDGADTDQFKEVMHFLNDLYNNDTLHPGEAKMLPATQSSNDLTNQVLGRGNTFMFCGTPQNMQNGLLTAKRNGVEYMSFIIKNSKREDPQLGDIAGTGDLINCISTACKNPEAAIKAFAYMWSGEGQKLASYGLEGEADEYGNIIGVKDPEFAKIFKPEDCTYYVDGNGVHHYTESYYEVLSGGNDKEFQKFGLGQWNLFTRPSYLNSCNWGEKRQTNADSAYVLNMKKPLSVYSCSYHFIGSLLDSIADNYAEMSAIRSEVNGAWASRVVSIFTQKDWTDAQKALKSSLTYLDKLGRKKLYAEYTKNYIAKKVANGVEYGYALNDPNYVKKTISPEGVYKWSNDGKDYSDVFGAIGDITYYTDYDII